MPSNADLLKLDPKQTAQRVLDIIHKLTQELRREQTNAVSPRLDSDFDRDLGFDSLTRAELVQRIEKEFGITLPEQTLAVMETPRDLLHEVLCSISRGPAKTSR